MSLLRLLLVCAVLVFSLLRSGTAGAETLTCTDITTLPYTIATAGNYCLNKNFAASYASHAIVINASNVTLDCNDHNITQTGSAAVYGIYAANKSLITVRNCTVISFASGIAFFETAAGYSRNNRISGNDVRKSRTAGIQAAGSANIVENNRISDNIGGAGIYTYGILLSSSGAKGVGNIIRNNLITNIATSVYVNVEGIYLLDVQNTAVKDNVISALFPPTGEAINAIVGSPNTFGTAVIGNTILSATGSPPGGGGGLAYGGASTDGIRFDAVPSTTNRNVCRSNTVGHFISDISAETGSDGCVIDANTTF